MTNYEYFRGDAEALSKAFDAYCNRFGKCRDNCRFKTGSLLERVEDCMARFICAEHEEQPVKKRRHYTFEEAKGLLGKRLVWSDGGYDHCQTITVIDHSKVFDVVYLNMKEQAYLMENNATIDGEPFGVLEEVTE